MMEVPLRPWNPAPGQQHLLNWEQRSNPSKSIVVGKSLNVLSLLSGFCSSASGWLFLLTEVCQFRMWVLCFKAHSKKGSGLHSGPEHVLYLDHQRASVWICFLDLFSSCCGEGLLRGSCLAFNSETRPHQAHSLPLSSTLSQHSSSATVREWPVRSCEVRTPLLRRTPSRSTYHAAAGILYKCDSRLV